MQWLINLVRDSVLLSLEKPKFRGYFAAGTPTLTTVSWNDVVPNEITEDDWVMLEPGNNHFTIREAGEYLFFVTITVTVPVIAGRYLQLRFQHNGQVFLLPYSLCDNQSRMSIQGHIILKCQKDDEVYVEIYNSFASNLSILTVVKSSGIFITGLY